MNLTRSLSVVVPVFNVEAYLERCVESIANQSYPIENIILVDDGSTDNSGKIADCFAEKYDNVIVVHQKNGGLSAARNTGLTLVKTEYVTFVDSDDYIDKDMYKILMEQMDTCRADVSIGGVWYEKENGEKSSPYRLGIKKVFSKHDALKELNSYRYFNMSFCNKIFKTSLFNTSGYGEEELRFPDGKVSEDQYVMHKILARAEVIAYTSQPLYHYIQRMGSISRNTKINLEVLNAATAQMEFYQKWFPEIAYIAESACVFHYIAVCAGHIKRRQDIPKYIYVDTQKLIKTYWKSIGKNDVVPLKKKLQAFVFKTSFAIYKLIVYILY